MGHFSDVRLNLSILRPDSPRRLSGGIELPPVSGILTLRQGEFAGRSYQASLQACDAPACACCKIRLQCQPLGNDSRPLNEPVLSTWLDAWDRQTVKAEDASAGAVGQALGKAIVAELTDADWDELFRWFRAAKLEVIYSKELAEADLDLLPVVARGQMVPFADIFPWGHAMDFKLSSELWTVDEQFCVQTNCTCNEVLFGFVRYAEPLGKTMLVPEPPPALRYNYKRKTVTRVVRWPPTAPAQDTLMEALMYYVPSLNEQLALRHEIIKCVYLRRFCAELDVKRSELERAADVLAKQAQDLEEQLRQQGVNSGPARSYKSGRNEPCPCGSGKKFKNCCLGKKTG